MALSDDVLAGESYFITELKAFRRILTAVERGERVLCAIDEILRGTNTVERIAASSTLLRYLAGETAVCIAATHDIELCALLSDAYDMAHFERRLPAIPSRSTIACVPALPARATPSVC